LVNHLFYTVSDMERVGDHAENLAEFVQYRQEHGFTFSDNGESELKEICQIVYNSFHNSILARKTENIEYVKNVAKLEEDVDNLEEELREKHIERLSKGECEAQAGVIFLDIISNLERISDHAQNIAGYVRDEKMA
ncbi:MAG TPA: Na/Pi cotransporter, partial [Lachnospiraceae bacterium]|nr:Na/Pi cotransporter [Lachnospiraceae bacterium]